VKHLHDDIYEVVAKRVLATATLSILDFGILAYCEDDPRISAHGANERVRGQLSLGVDPFSCFERLAQQPEIPPMIYTWRIESIFRQTAPFIETTLEGGRKMLARDESKLGYANVRKTDAWTDDDGNAEY
jgi:hypothetical protein